MLADGDSIFGPVGRELRPDDAIAVEIAPHARVARLRPVVAEDEVLVRRDDALAERRLATPSRVDVVLFERPAVDDDASAAEGDPVAGQADDPVHERRAFGRAAPRGTCRWKLVRDDVTALRVANAVLDLRDEDAVGLVPQALRNLARDVARAMQGRLHRRGRDPIRLRRRGHEYDRDADNRG